MRKARLFTYCISYDGGSAPNPYGGICTLAICKPKIRSTAEVGDWVAATAGSTAPWNDGKVRLVYAMKVTQRLSMKEYDQYCKADFPVKIPRRPARTFEEFVGDSIYDFSTTNPPNLRPSVHLEENKERDLGGKCVLLSNTYCYFGDKAIELPKELHPIMKTGQGHQSDKNAPLVDAFISWITSYLSLQIQGQPIHGNKEWSSSQKRGSCSAPHLSESESDENYSE